MKKPYPFTGLLLGALLSAVALGTPNVTGKWSGALQMGNDSKPFSLILKQDGNRVAGSLRDNEGGEPLRFEGGKVEGNKVTFDVKLHGEGPGLMHFDLQVEGDQITGEARRTGESLNQAAKVSLKRVAEK